MNVTIEEVNSVKRKLNVELPEEDVRKAWRKLLDAYVKKARIKGFRPGKAPRDMVARVYAEELKREVTEEMVSEVLPAILKEHDLTPLGSPLLDNVDYQDELPRSFSILLEVKPVFTAPEWRGLSLKRPRSRVNGELVAKKLGELRQSLSTVRKLDEDRPLVMGDAASVKYQAYDENGAEQPGYGGGPFNIDLDDSRGLTPGFIAGLVGMKAGETKDITVTLPEDSGDGKIAGKTLKLVTTVLELMARDLPDLDNEFAKDLGLDGVETLDALKERLLGDLMKEEADQIDSLLNRQVTEQLAELISLDLPTVMVEREISNRLHKLNANLRGLDFKEMGVDTAQLRERIRPRAEKSVTAALVLDRVGQENQIAVTPEDIEAELTQMSREYGQSAEVLRGYYKSHNLMDSLREGLRISKTLDLIKAQAAVEEVERLELGVAQEDQYEGDRPDAAGAATDAALGEADEPEEAAGTGAAEETP